uniref:MARVEL domain-containing protein n=1 Tax=Knipowitschia caucasica TaxID=637954 RepID=A0AAV2K4G5_KNICA
MDSPPEDAARPQRVALYSAITLFNFIWWMILLAAIGFGALHLGSCPVEPLIPVYMMVLGSVTLMSLTLVYTNSIWGDGAVFKAAASCVSLLYLFDLCWFIAGSVWVYSVYPPDNSPDSTNYCSRPFYLFAFIVTTVIWWSSESQEEPQGKTQGMQGKKLILGDGQELTEVKCFS